MSAPTSERVTIPAEAESFGDHLDDLIVDALASGLSRLSIAIVLADRAQRETDRAEAD